MAERDERYLNKLRTKLSTQLRYISDRTFHNEIFHAVVFFLACAVGGYVGARLSTTAMTIVSSILAVGSTVYRVQGRSLANLIPITLTQDSNHATPGLHSATPGLHSATPGLHSATQGFHNIGNTVTLDSNPPSNEGQLIPQTTEHSVPQNTIERHSFLSLSTTEKKEIGNLLLRRIGIPCIESVLNFLSVPENRAWVMQLFRRKNLVSMTTQTERVTSTATTQTVDPLALDDVPLISLDREPTVYYDSLHREPTVYYDSENVQEGKHQEHDTPIDHHEDDTPIDHHEDDTPIYHHEDDTPID